MAATGATTKAYGALERPEISAGGLLYQVGRARFKGNKVTSITTPIQSGKVVFVRAQYYKGHGAGGSGSMVLTCTGTVKSGKLAITRTTIGVRKTTALTYFWYEVVGYP